MERAHHNFSRTSYCLPGSVLIDGRSEEHGKVILEKAEIARKHKGVNEGTGEIQRNEAAR